VVAIRIEQVAYTYCVTRGTIYNTCIGSTNRDKQMKYEEFKTIMAHLYNIQSQLNGESCHKNIMDHWNVTVSLDDTIDMMATKHPKMWIRYCDELPMDKFYIGKAVIYRNITEEELVTRINER